MKLIFISFLICLSFQIDAQTITRFESEADVLVYLNNKADFSNKNNGVTLTFFEMGGRMRSNKGVSYYNPDVTILTSTRAVVVYESLTSGGIAKIIVDCKENVIADKSDMTVYTPDSDEDNDIAENVPVRKFVNENVNLSPSKIIGKPIKIGKLLVAQYNFPNKLNYKDAKALCAKLGSGWRLPTKVELNTLYQNKERIGGFVKFIYWSSTEYDKNFSYGQDFSDGNAKHTPAIYTINYVRAVKVI
jgi:hypothetical protein